LAISGIVAFTALFLGSTPITYAATYTVNSTSDGGDFSTADGVCDTDDSVGDGPCTLRAAIGQANASSGTDTITFGIAGIGPHTISPGSALPAISDPLTIDGYAQPGASPNTNVIGLGSNAVLMIELDGSGTGGSGLTITAGDTTVRGLVINRFKGSGGNGIEIADNGGNTIEGNNIGTDATGIADLGNSGAGISIVEAPSNRVGGTDPGARNVISGNDYGISIVGGATGNLVQGNYIGTDVTGSTGAPTFVAAPA
jgi:hypothetical protein